MQKLTPDTKLTPENFIGTYWVYTKPDLPKHIAMIVSIRNTFTGTNTIGPIFIAAPHEQLVGMGDGGSFEQIVSEFHLLFEDYLQLSLSEYLDLMTTEFVV